METYDVVVVGLGAAGSSTVRALAAAGMRVLGLERFGPAHARGSSHGGTRIVRRAYAEGAAFVPLLLRAHELWEELSRTTGRAVWRRTGVLITGREDSEAVVRTAECARRFALEHHMLDADGIRRLSVPGAWVPDEAVACYDPTAGLVHPEEALLLHHRLARGDGARLRFHEPMVRFAAGRSGLTVETPRARYAAGHLVLCPGSWSELLLPGVSVPVQARRQVQHWFELRPDTAHHFAPDRFPVHIWQAPGIFFAMPAVDGPAGGVKCSQEADPPPCDPDAVDRRVRRDEIERSAAELRRYLPGRTGRWMRSTVCTYPRTPDNHFVLGRAPGHEAVTLVTGLGGHGFKFMPVFGEIVLGLLTGGGRFTAEELRPFAPDRVYESAGAREEARTPAPAGAAGGRRARTGRPVPAGWSAAERRVWRDLERGPEVGRSDIPERCDPSLDGLRVPLPTAPTGSAVTEVLRRRRSRRDMTGPLPLSALADVLTGLFRGPKETTPTSPTCGGTGSLTPYLLANDVTGLAPGLYACADGSELIGHPVPPAWRRSVNDRVNGYLRRDPAAGPPPVVLLWRADWVRIMARYPGGGLLAVFWDAGAAVQSAYLLAEERGLAGCACAGLPRTDEIRELGWDPDAYAFAAAFALGRRQPRS
ncbi:N-methyl-L-tryptophan oxidase [Streptomyces albireticuli]|uniref:N-methyl-L-tryptophan oxidase n=1 Tax=Streptomyces albireticuli TaxID=1940 RepID=A0A2A2D125_9ACTN|nr:N-methyl-L-tryptophan oxidase [Streptomyces albireticuli]MCD9196106.1 N-methyl-L-tryptophan oxidase [Streptomyces albireticuli]PAU46143.1 N-methyl-L-tryptophan oxidase [Streptomyces albireticuli]